jgi:hypothetical protein
MGVNGEGVGGDGTRTGVVEGWRECCGCAGGSYRACGRVRSAGSEEENRREERRSLVSKIRSGSAEDDDDDDCFSSLLLLSLDSHDHAGDDHNEI